MSAQPIIAKSPKQVRVIYPETDGQPMAENTVQFDWIVKLKENIDSLFHDRPDVFVAGDLFWYPIEGDNKTCTAPDVLIAFGPLKGPRGSYMQWEEGDIAPQVVLEVLSPANRLVELARKLKWYERFGVEEYYVVDPGNNEVTGWLRQGSELIEIPTMNGWISPRLGIRFEFVDGDVHVYFPDGREFPTFQEVIANAAADREMAQREASRAEHEAKRAEHEASRAARLAEKLIALGIDPDQI